MTDVHTDEHSATEEYTGGVIKDVPLLDLSHATSEEDLAHIRSIEDVSAVLVPHDLAHLLSRIEMSDVSAIIPVAAGAHVRVHTGSVLLGGDALAEPGGDNEILVVTGALIVTSPVPRVGYSEIVVTGSVLGPRGSESTLGAGLTRVTGSVDYYTYAEGQQFKQFAGQVKVSGEVLGNPGGSPDDVLIAGGQIMVTSPVHEVGFQRIIIGGQLIAPRDSQSVLGPALSVGGQVAWYGGQPRFFVGSDTFGADFFSYLPEPVALVLVGAFEIEDDVQPDAVREKITEITVVGNLTAPKPLVPLLQVLATEKYGEISVAGDDTGD